MKRFISLFAILLFSFNLSFSKVSDTLKTFELPLIHIISQREIPFVEKHKYGTDYNSNLLNQNGFSLIRRGLNFTQDLYVEGFKKGDFKVIVDGEHYHNACPNRMDAPVTRINLMDIESVELTKSSSIIGTGLYGKVEYHRSNLEDKLRIKSMLNGSTGATKDYDLSLAGEGLNTSLTLRYASGEPYKNGEGKNFKELYGYKDNYPFSYYTGSIRHKINLINIELGAHYTQAKNISFPYLQMDEIMSKVYGGYLEYQSHKLYFNYTDHLMNNSLRNSSMFMETRAKNLTFGISGKFYELVYRNWKADNFISMMSNSITNKLMPDVHQLSLNLSENFSYRNFNLFFKGGIQTVSIKDKSRISFYDELYNNVQSNRTFILSGLSLSYSAQLTNDLISSTTADFSSDAPEPEVLYIAVKRLMTSPDWSGNPNLKQPYRFGLRSNFNYKFFNFELFTNYVVNYIEIVKKMKTPTKPAMTYENTKALLLGSNLNFKYKYLETNISYLWGENINKKEPLSEIAPLSINTSIQFPILKNLSFSVYHRYENAQKRVNPYLKEFATRAYNSLGLGLSYDWNEIYFDLRINNLLNHNYYKFLSYSRNPFSTGSPVYEPGRNISLNVYLNKIL